VIYHGFMAMRMDAAATARLNEYFGQIGDVLGLPSRRESFAVYAMGVLGDGDRKSVEPIASRACGDARTADAAHQSLLHFISNARWSDRSVRLAATWHALKAMALHSPVQTWIVDDTGFLKQGKHSVGVQRQYTGSAGKVTNCQVGVSLSVATNHDQVPVDFELYLPETWTSDATLRSRARIPEALQFKTKPQLALDMLRRAVKDKIPKGVVLADAGYGTSNEFRREVRKLHLHYAVGVDPQTKIWLLDPLTQLPAAKQDVRSLAYELDRGGGFRRCTWREGTKQDLSARFAALRIVAAHDDGQLLEDRDQEWLLIEWRDGEDEPANYFLSSLPARMTKKQLVRIVMQRWRTERAYEDLKGELGLDHFEGRSFPGWHHHVSVVLCCYAFVVAERARHFPPSASGKAPRDAHTVAA
jgi:SRSO17 transposase